MELAESNVSKTCILLTVTALIEKGRNYPAFPKDDPIFFIGDIMHLQLPYLTAGT